jgi:hypothetical protein
MARLLALSALLLAASSAAGSRPAGGPVDPSHAHPAARTASATDVAGACHAGAPAVHALAAAAFCDLPRPRPVAVAAVAPLVAHAEPLPLLALAPKTSPPASPRRT